MLSQQAISTCRTPGRGQPTESRCGASGGAPRAAMIGASSYRWLCMHHTREERDTMSEQVQATAVVDVSMSTPVGDIPVVLRPQFQTISDLRQIAAVVMARMNLINTKKDELTIAMKGLTD